MRRLLLSRCCFLLLLMLPMTGMADAVDELRQFYARASTLHTVFSQKVLDENGAVTDTMSGELWLSRPAVFRWEYHEPYQQTMVNDGQKLWLYDVDLAQVTVRDAEQALSGAPVWLLSGGPALEEQFQLVNDDSVNGVQWVRIIPRQEGGDFKQARMGLKEGLPEVLELLDALGQKTVIEFEQVNSNLVIPAGRFQFTPPAGVEVVEG